MAQMLLCDASEEVEDSLGAQIVRILHFFDTLLIRPSLRYEKRRFSLFNRFDLLNRTDPVETVRNA